MANRSAEGPPLHKGGSPVSKEAKKLRRRKRKREYEQVPVCYDDESNYVDSPTPACSFGNWAGNIFGQFSKWLVSYDYEDDLEGKNGKPDETDLGKNQMLMSWDTMDGSSGSQIVVTDLAEEESFQMDQADLAKLGPGYVALFCREEFLLLFDLYFLFSQAYFVCCVAFLHFLAKLTPLTQEKCFV